MWCVTLDRSAPLIKAWFTSRINEHAVIASRDIVGVKKRFAAGMALAMMDEPPRSVIQRGLSSVRLKMDSLKSQIVDAKARAKDLEMASNTAECRANIAKSKLKKVAMKVQNVELKLRQAEAQITKNLDKKREALRRVEDNKKMEVSLEANHVDPTQMERDIEELTARTAQVQERNKELNARRKGLEARLSAAEKRLSDAVDCETALQNKLARQRDMLSKEPKVKQVRSKLDWQREISNYEEKIKQCEDRFESSRQRRPSLEATAILQYKLAANYRRRYEELKISMRDLAC